MCVYTKQNKQIDSNDKKIILKEYGTKNVENKVKKNYGCYGDDRFA